MFLLSNEVMRELVTAKHTQRRRSCLAPYIRPLIFGFSNKVSGTGGRMFNAW